MAFISASLLGHTNLALINVIILHVTLALTFTLAADEDVSVTKATAEALEVNVLAIR